jgi:MFS family permease
LEADLKLKRPTAVDSGYAWYSISLLTFAAIISNIDRQILALMIGPVRRDLGITDVQVSLLLGLAFTLLFTVTALPVARLADKVARSAIIGAGVLFWSLMTSMSGVAQNYVQLFLARMGVGIGEATLGPASYSLISDLFSEARMPIAAGLFQSSTFVGTGLAYILGGTLVGYLETQPAVSLPLVGEVRSWQLTFLIVGLPGVLVAFAIAKMREPLRRGLANTETDAEPFPLGEIWRFMLRRWRFFGLHFAGYLLMATQGYALFAWGAEFFIRVHDFSRVEAGLTFGLIALVFGIAGSLCGGLFSSLLIRGGKLDGMMRLGMYKCLCVVPFAVLLGFTSSAALAVALLVPLVFLMALTPGLGAAIVQAVAPNEIKAQMVAVYGVAVSFISYLVAPLMVAAMTQYVFGRDDAVGYSLASLASVVYPLAALCLGRCLVHYRESLRLAQAWSDS